MKKKLLKIDKQAKGSAKFNLSLTGAFQTFQKVLTFQFPAFCGRTAPPLPVQDDERTGASGLNLSKFLTIAADELSYDQQLTVFQKPVKPVKPEDVISTAENLDDYEGFFCLFFLV